jgi:hypothetical protein
MAEDFGFDTNLMRFVVAQLHFLLSMTAAREMFGKGYFALGPSEKAVVDQIVTANVAGNFQQLTPALLAAQQAQQTSGFWNPSRRTQAGEVIDASPFGFCP